MIVLDTDHLSTFQWARSSAAVALRDRLRAVDEPVATTIITLEEQARGWLAEISRKRKARDQIPPYRKLQELFAFFGGWTILAWSEAAVEQFQELKSQRIRIGTMDLKIASIVLTHDATLLTRNRADFEQVPDLRIENWLD
ncbi:MAG TPA: type II toxin-antitoxin system VapC family toxin [Planctomycetaceae bacterium]|nr:type II toxin-antitoxin system VapC family toxin [Planctomycetaceae bacterium]